MRQREVTRRDFLRLATIATGGAVVAACAPTTPVVIEKEVIKEVPVEKPVIVKEEVVREVPVEKVVEKEVIKEVPVEKVVEKEVIKEVAVEKIVTPTPKPVGKVTLEFWGRHSPESYAPDIEEWNEAHPDIQVKYVFVPGASAVGTMPKFLAATLGGNPPDLIDHDGSNYVTSSNLNAFEELDDLAAQDGITSDLYWEAFWPKVTWKGHIYGLPHHTDARCLYWNKAFFEEAGLTEAPETIVELDEVAEKLTQGTRAAGYDRVGFIPWTGNWFLCAWGWAFGAKLWDPATNKIHLNCPEMVEVVEWEVGYAEKYGVEELTAFTKAIAGETTDPFTTENVAMEVQGNWMLSHFRRYNPDLEYGMAPVPVPEGREFITWSGGFCVGIPRGAKYIEASWEFLKWICGEGSLGYCNRWAVIPTYRPVAEDFATSNPEQDLFIELMPATKIEPVIPEWELAWDEHLAAEQEALYGRKTPQEALDDANAKVQEAIDRRLAEEG